MPQADKTPNAPTGVGWREFLALPDWGIRRIKAKIDTGARTSAVHVENLKLLPENQVSFDVVVRESPHRTVSVTTSIHRYSQVRPSFDKLERRPVVLARVQIGTLEHEIELALVSRQGMLCRMLLGRRGLPPGVLVDPHRRFLVSDALLSKDPKE